MSIIYVLITVSVLVAVVFFVAFVYSVKRGQYDDTYTPSVRMLFEDELVKANKEQIKANKKELIKTSNP